MVKPARSEIDPGDTEWRLVSILVWQEMRFVFLLRNKEAFGMISGCGFDLEVVYCSQKPTDERMRLMMEDGWPR